MADPGHLRPTILKRRDDRRPRRAPRHSPTRAHDPHGSRTSCCSRCRKRGPMNSRLVVRERMESAAVLEKYPLTVDVGIGENWKDAKALTLPALLETAPTVAAAYPGAAPWPSLGRGTIACRTRRSRVGSQRLAAIAREAARADPAGLRPHPTRPAGPPCARAGRGPSSTRRAPLARVAWRARFSIRALTFW